MIKKFFIAASLISSVSAFGVEPVDSLKNIELQEVQVVSTRATSKTPIAFSNVGAEQLKSTNYGVDIPFLLSLGEYGRLRIVGKVYSGAAWCRYFHQRLRSLRCYGEYVDRRPWIKTFRRC